jgi:rhodanese-related sulfurtransferase
MAEQMPRADEVENLTPEEVDAGLRAGRMLLVDVREPNETAVESYPDAVIVPLSCCNSRSAGQAGCLCLPLWPALDYRFGCRAGCRLSVQIPSCRRHHCVEGGGPANQTRILTQR